MVASSSHRAVVGCAGLPQGLRRSRFFEQVDLLETDALAKGSVKSKTLRRWRQECPGSAFSLVAPPALGVAPGAPPAAALAALTGAIEALAPQLILLRTPVDFSPSTANRAGLTALAKALPAGDYQLAWEPQGLWSADAARPLADELGWLVAFDPLQPAVLGQESHAPDAPEVYFRLTGLGSGRRQFSDDDLYHLAERIHDTERAIVVFANLDKHRDARRFRALLDA